MREGPTKPAQWRVTPDARPQPAWTFQQVGFGPPSSGYCRLCLTPGCTSWPVASVTSGCAGSPPRYAACPPVWPRRSSRCWPCSPRPRRPRWLRSRRVASRLPTRLSPCQLGRSPTARRYHSTSPSLRPALRGRTRQSCWPTDLGAARTTCWTEPGTSPVVGTSPWPTRREGSATPGDGFTSTTRHTRSPTPAGSSTCSRPARTCAWTGRVTRASALPERRMAGRSCSWRQRPTRASTPWSRP